MTIKAVIELLNLSELVRKPFITFLKIKKIHGDGIWHLALGTICTGRS